MEIGITLNNNLVYNKEFSLLKITAKSLILVVTLMSLTSGITAFALSGIGSTATKITSEVVIESFLNIESNSTLLLGSPNVKVANVILLRKLLRGFGIF